VTLKYSYTYNYKKKYREKEIILEEKTKDLSFPGEETRLAPD